MRVIKRTERRERTERTETSLTVSCVSCVLCILSVLSCARIEPPPGGPPDFAPPQLVSTRPDSMGVIPGFAGEVEFRFDEVVSEGASPSRGAGTGDLERLIILSPTDRVPDVTWRRNRITVRPAEGWRRNRVYRVSLLPGVADLRRNRSTEGAVVTFTTGAPLPQTTLEGVVVDWTTSRPGAGALVEALLLPDSLPYRGLADSSGRFSLGPLPTGEYLVRGILDQNRNFLLDSREAFDSTRIPSGRTAVGEIWTFVHDTVPPRIRNIAVSDSLTAAIDFSQMLDPRQRLKPEAVSLRLLPDSLAMEVVSILPKVADDSTHAPAVTPPDSAPSAKEGEPPSQGRPPIGRPGGLGRRPDALTTKPPLSSQLILRVALPWRPGRQYAIEVRGVRNVTGVAGDAEGVLTVPKRPGETADSLKAAADSAAGGRDSLRPGVPIPPARTPKKRR